MTAPVCSVCQGTDVRPVAHRWQVPVSECRSCGARFVYPQPGARETRDRYQGEHQTGKWEKRFEAQNDSEVRRRAELVLELTGTTGSLLDVGSGDGRFLRAATQVGWSCVGCEISESAAALAPGHAVFVGGLDGLVEAPTFDTVTFWDVLEHMPDPGTALLQARARLRPGGVVAVTMPNVHGTASRSFGGAWPYYDFETYGHLFHLNPGHIASLMSQSGLEVTYQETRGSVDLRDVPGARLGVTVPRPVQWALDRASGLVARFAVPRGRGNTMLVAGRRLD